MTAMGQSAGSIFLVLHSFAYAGDHIVSAYIQLSGTEMLQQPPGDGSKWALVAGTIGFATASEGDPFKELECLRDLSPRALRRAISPSNLMNFSGNKGGAPAIDNKTMFTLEEYGLRRASGRFARVVSCTPMSTRSFLFLTNVCPADSNLILRQRWRSFRRFRPTC